jgi:serine protease AprX
MKRHSVLSMGLAGLFLSILLNVTRAVPVARPANVAAQVWDAVAAGDTAEFLVLLDEQANLSAAASLPTREARLRYVYDALRETALRSQVSLRVELDAAGVDYRPFYVVNMLAVKGDLELVTRLAARPEVARIAANPRVRQSLPTPSPYGGGSGRGIAAVEWGVARVNADDVWALGHTGEGIVVAGGDTGYEWEHPALINQYRGYNGITATHDYNWHDAIHSGGGICGADSPEPCDDYSSSHGTHTMGTMVGDDGGSNQIGVAPGARWIGCRNMDVGVGSPAAYIECFEFFLAPYPIGGDPLTDGVPDLAPHVINNSWTCLPSEGCDAAAIEAMRLVIENVRAAGIVVVASAGNNGSACSTVDKAPAIYDAVFSVGATDSSDNIAGFSSRGPVTADGSGRLKPDVSAPGVSVRSSQRGDSYGYLSGTSMAGPHVAGTVALLWSAVPDLVGDVDATEQIVAQTARPRTTTQGCGGDGPNDVPNNVYGWGIVDALAAVQAGGTPSLEVVKRGYPDPVLAGAPLTYTLRVTNTGGVALNAVVTDILPACVAPTGALTWTLDSFAPGAVWTEEVFVTVGAGCPGSLTNVVQVTTEEGAAGIYTETTPVLIPALAVSKRATPDPALAGKPLTYTLRVTNTGTAMLAAVITDVLPNQVTPTGVLTWTLDAFAPGAVWAETVVVTVAADYAGSLTNVAQVTTAEGATGIYTETTSALIPGLMVGNEAYPDPVLAGAQLTYTLRVTNTGTATLTVTITDLLPDRVAPTGVLTWTPGLLAPGGVWMETVVVTVEADYGGPLINTIRVTTEEGPAGVYTTTTCSLASSGLVVTKEAAFLSGFPVRRLVYTLTATNAVSATLDEVLLTDTIPLSTTFVWASGNYTRTDDVIAWMAESLMPQETLTATLMVSVEGLPSGMRVVNAAYGARAGVWRVPVRGTSVEVIVPWRYLLFPIFRNWVPGGDDGG